MSGASAQLVAPTADRYTSAFRSLSPLADSHLAMLRFHYWAPDRTVTATQMARAAQFKHYGAANLTYGRLGRRVGVSLNFHPTTMPVDALVTQAKPDDEWLWTMRPQVAQALEQLDWVTPGGFVLPDEVLPAAPLVEGSVCRITVNAYERNPEARRRCITAHGTKCCICEFSFGAVYGAEADGYIHVHHVRPLSEVKGEYVIDPVEDLRPVCPNCHAVLHKGGRCRTIEEVRRLLERQRTAQPGAAADPATRAL